jgi:hypothetical protein
MEDDTRDAEEDNSRASGLKQTHKDIYGLLLLVNHRIYDVVGWTFFVLISSALFLCVSIYMRWFDSLLGIPLDRLRDIGVYVLIAVIAFLASTAISNFRGNMVYRAARTEILNRLNKSNISIETLLAEIADDKKLDQIRDKMMKDKEIQQTPERYL